MTRHIFYLTLLFFLSSCATMMVEPRPNLTHSYELTVLDVNGNPLRDATVRYTLKNLDMTVKDTTAITNSSGRVVASVMATADPQYTYVKSYKTEFNYKVSKDGYYSKSGLAYSHFGDEYSNNKQITSEDATLIRPIDYIKPSFLASKEGEAIKSNILGFIDVLLLQSLLTDSYLETQSIELGNFKEKSYLSFTFHNTNVYNSLKLNKYDIAKTLFDEVIRKVLNPLNDHLEDSNSFFGYDLTVFGYTKSFADKYASNQKIIYRFFIPNEVVQKYKQKDISGQQVLDASIILMDDERIDLKLQ